jgi:thioredoxin 1
MVKEISSIDEYTRITKEKKLVIIDFFATWCGPCRAIAPELDELAQEFKSSVIIVKIDVDNQDMTEVMSRHKIRAMPTFIFIKNGKILDKVEGAKISDIKKKVEKHLDA